MFGRKTSVAPQSGAVRCLIAAGGTGGHLFPGIAVARALEALSGGAQVLFVVGRRRMATDILRRSGYPWACLDVEGLLGRGWGQGLRVLLGLPRSFGQAWGVLRSFKPHVVLGMGAYSAGPVCVVARILGIPTAIHEQNAYPGLTNRWLAPWVHRVFVSFPQSRAHLRGRPPEVTGNPVRPELLAAGSRPEAPGRPFTVLVLGGSQGARGINQAFVEALIWAKEKRLRIAALHQTGGTDFERVRRTYEAAGLKGELYPFIDDMAAAYGRAHLVVSRAGASTVFELAALGKPALLVPYPYAANRHQEHNARALAEMGGAEMIPEDRLTGESLGRKLFTYASAPEALLSMSKAAKRLARPGAAEHIARELSAMRRT